MIPYSDVESDALDRFSSPNALRNRSQIVRGPQLQARLLQAQSQFKSLAGVFEGVMAQDLLAMGAQQQQQMNSTLPSCGLGFREQCVSERLWCLRQAGTGVSWGNREKKCRNSHSAIF